MKMTSRNVRWLFILLMIIAPLFYAWYTHYQRNHFTCESHLIIVDENSRLDALMTFTFNNGAGSYDSTGEYSRRVTKRLPSAIKLPSVTGAKKGELL